MAVLSWLRRSWPLVVVIGYAATLYIYGSTQRGVGYATAKAEGDQALTALRLEYAEQRAAVADEGALRLRQQIARADQAEQLMQQTQQQLADAQRQLQERIPHVTTVYRPAPDVAPVAIPRCVFTRGWLRDYNAALGADLPPLEPLVVPPSLKKRPAPPPALTPNYWKAASLPPTSWLTPRTTAAGRSATPPSSTSCSICRKGSSPIWTL